MKQLRVIALPFFHFTSTSNPEIQCRHIKTQIKTRHQLQQEAPDGAGAPEELPCGGCVKDQGWKTETGKGLRRLFIPVSFVAHFCTYMWERGSVDLSHFTSQKINAGEAKWRYNITCSKAIERSSV